MEKAESFAITSRDGESIIVLDIAGIPNGKEILEGFYLERFHIVESQVYLDMTDVSDVSKHSTLVLDTSQVLIILYATKEPDYIQ